MSECLRYNAGLMKIEALLDTSAILAGQPTPVHLLIRFTAPTLAGNARERPIAFSAVIDRSGSMAGPPLHAACEAAKLAVKNLRTGDQFSLVVFDDQARTIVPLQPATDKEAILARIDQVNDGGSTNLTAGWMLGRDELLKADPNTPRRLLLLTDGQLNVGITEPTMVRTIVASGLEKGSIRTSTLGFGEGYEERLLADLAGATGGGFYDANSPEKLPAIFAAELEGLQSIAIQNLRLRIRKLDFCDTLALFADYPVIDLPDGRKEIAVGDLVSDERRTLILGLQTLAIPPLPDGQPAASLEGEDLLGLEVAFDEITPEGIASKTWSQTLRVVTTQEPGSIRTNDEVVAPAALQRAARAVDEALKLSQGGQTAAAIALLRDELQALERLGAGPLTKKARDMVTKLLEQFQEPEGPSVQCCKDSLYSSRSYRRMSSAQHWSSDEPPPDYIASTDTECSQ